MIEEIKENWFQMTVLVVMAGYLLMAVGCAAAAMVYELGRFLWRLPRSRVEIAVRRWRDCGGVDGCEECDALRQAAAERFGKKENVDE